MADPSTPALRARAEQVAKDIRARVVELTFDGDTWFGWGTDDARRVADIIDQLLAALTLDEQEREKEQIPMPDKSCEPPKSLGGLTEARDSHSSSSDPMNNQPTAHDLLDRYRAQFASEDQFEHMCATVNLALCRRTECGQMVPTGTGSTVCKRPNGHAGVCSSSEARLAVVEPQGPNLLRILREKVVAFQAGTPKGGSRLIRAELAGVHGALQVMLSEIDALLAPPRARGSDTPEP